MQLGHLAPIKAGLDFPRHKTEGIDPGESQRYTKLAPPESISKAPEVHFIEPQQKVPGILGRKFGQLGLGGAARPKLGDFRRRPRCELVSILSYCPWTGAEVHPCCRCLRFGVSS